VKPTIHIKRVYEEPSKADGYRVLIDRLWPRGFTKAHAAIDEWAKELAPTASLRKWFNHAPEKWPEFKKKYKAELKTNDALKTFLEEHSGEKQITLVYAGKDEEHTHALVLQEILEQEFAR
jgi:uncharacterized protein YeaO (DUF488 family)